MKILASSVNGDGKVGDEKDKNTTTSWQQLQQQFSNHQCNDQISGSDDNYSCPCKLVNGSNQPSITGYSVNPVITNPTISSNHKSRKEKWSSIDLNTPNGQRNSRDIESLSTMSDDLYYKYIRLSLLLITFLAATGIILITLGFLFFNYYQDRDTNDHHEVELGHVYLTDQFFDTSPDYHDYSTQVYDDIY